MRWSVKSDGAGKKSGRGLPRSKAPTGFTLVELLAVVSVIALLLGLLLPAVNRARTKVDQAACLNNLKQLQAAWQMYIDDHDGFVPENYADRSTGVWRSSPNSWAGPSSAPFDGDASSIRVGSFYRLNYVGSVETFHCPGDDSIASNGKDKGLRRARSYSMNGNFAGRKEELQTVFVRESLGFNPAGVFVFVDEHEESIDDAQFLVWPKPDDRWVNLPAGRHNRCGVLSFSDGHVEAWKWKARKGFSPRESYWKRAKGPDLDDLRRLQETVLPIDNYKPQQ